MSAPELASRVMRARRESLCAYCWQPIKVGQIIAKTTLGWLHAGCSIARMYGNAEGKGSRTRSTA
jgi:hypothetical protein